MSTASIGGLFGNPSVKTVAPPTQADLVAQAQTQANSTNQSLLQALSQQARFGFRQNLTTSAGVGPKLAGDQ